MTFLFLVSLFEHWMSVFIFTINNAIVQVMLHIWRNDWSSQLCTQLKHLWIKAWKKKSQAWTEFEPMTFAILVQCSTNRLSYQANWELATLWVRNIPVEGENYKWIYESSYIRAATIVAVMHTTQWSSCQIKPWKTKKKPGLHEIRTHELCAQLRWSVISSHQPLP